MAKCLVCDCEITDDIDSGEHLILASLGGRREVRGLLDRVCNSKAGETWDADLAKQLQPLSLMFGISRQRGGEAAPLRVVTTAQEHLTLGANGRLTPSRPVFQKIESEDGTISYQLMARSMSEAKTMLTGLKRKHPNLDVEGALAQAELGESYAQGDIKHDISIGGPASGRSIIKSCVAMAFASGVPWESCEHGVQYLRGAADAKPCYGFFNSRDLVSRGRVEGVPLHCLAVKADPASGLVLAYAEYYSIHRIVALLGSSYRGPFIQENYAIDPRDGSLLDVAIDLQFDQADIEEVYAYRQVSSERTIEYARKVIGPTLQRQAEAERQRVLNRAVEKAFATCGAKPGDLITPEFAQRIARSITESMMPLIAHSMRPLHSRPTTPLSKPNRKARRARSKGSRS